MSTIFKIVIGLAVPVLLVLLSVKIVTGVGDSDRKRGISGDSGSRTTTTTSVRPAPAPPPKTRTTARPRTRPAPAPSGGDRKFGFGRRSGIYQIVEASGAIENPGDLVAKVSSAPKQDVTLSYSIVCTRKGGNAVTSMGQEMARTPVAFALKKPEGDLKRCQVFTSGQLTKEGRMKTTLIG